MYCKNCGKEISDDSKFCKFCGTQMDDSPMIMNNFDDLSKTKSEVQVSAMEKSPVKIEIVKGTTVDKSAVANEIVSNVKMLGIAFLIWLIYIIGFIIIHKNDIKLMDENSWYGESCYDPSILSGEWIMDWQNQYAIKVLMAPDYSKNKKPLEGIEALAFAHSFTPLNGADYSLIYGMNAERALNYANNLAKDKRLDKEYQKTLKKKAIEAASADKEDFWSTINDYRQSGYKEDLHDNMIWAAIIALSLTILGRYIFKFIGWLIKHKT